MSDEKQETRADIIAEMRRGLDKSWHEIDREWLHDIPDRLEAAWKREREPKPLTIAEWIDKTETVADIAAVLRRYVLPSLAERLEAAWKREKAEVEADALNVGAVVATTEKSSAVGNAAAMREALGMVLRYLQWLYAQGCTDRCRLSDEIDRVAAALSAPPRQCDVGTEQEQQDRFREFCRHYESEGECGIGRSEAACPAFQGGRNPDCSLWWAQMPYAEEGGAK